MLLLFLFSAGISHKCIHDLKYGKFHQQMFSRRVREVKTRNLSEEDWKPIRVKFLTDWLDGTKYDEYKCNHTGQQVPYGQTTQTCTEDDLLTAEKIQVIKVTLENIQSYLSRLIKVVPRTDPVYLMFQHENEFNSSGIVTVPGADLAIFVTGRNFGPSTTLATGFGWESDDAYERPTSGYIEINVRQVPKQPASENDWNNYFFSTLLHEVFHVLGISIHQFSHYHPYNTNVPHSQIQCWIQKYGKNFTFMVTPYAHIFAKKRFGQDKFVGDDGKECPSGIELEDGDNAKGSHVEFRTYSTEIMVGITIDQGTGPYSRITDASLALLMDTGNYKVNWTMGQPLIWGNPESVNGKPIPNFALGPPQLTYPKGYLYISGNYPSFDYKYYGGHADLMKDADKTHESCRDGEKYCGDARYKFYNPNKTDMYDSDIFDYMTFVLPLNTCLINQAVFPGKDENTNTGCQNYTCDWYGKYNVTFSNGSITCTKESIGQQFPYWISGEKKMMTCVDPSRFCRTMGLYNMHFVKDPFDLSTKQLPDDPNEEPENPERNDPVPAGNSSEPAGNGPQPAGNSSEPKSSPPAEKTTNSDLKKKMIMMYSGVGGGAILLVIIVVIISVAISRKGAKKAEEKSPENSDGMSV